MAKPKELEADNDSKSKVIEQPLKSNVFGHELDGIC
jgi:hypothetical protein